VAKEKDKFNTKGFLRKSQKSPHFFEGGKKKERKI
jgi:hypothetical protein